MALKLLLLLFGSFSLIHATTDHAEQREILEKLIRDLELDIPFESIEKILEGIRAETQEGVLVNIILKDYTLDYDETDAIVDEFSKYLGIDQESWKKQRGIITDILTKEKIKLTKTEIGNLLFHLQSANLDWNSPNEVLNFIRLEQIIEKYHLPIAPEQFNDIVIQLSDVDWNSQSDVLLNLGRIINLNIVDWIIHREILVHLLEKSDLDLPPKKITDTLLLLEFRHFDFNVETELIKNLSIVLGININDLFNQYENLVNLLAKLNINLNSDQIRELHKYLLTLNPDWNSDISLLDAIGKYRNEDLTGKINLNSYANKIVEVIKKYNLKVSNDQITQIFKEIGESGLSEYQIIRRLQMIIDSNPTKKYWTFDEQKLALKKVLAKHGVKVKLSELNDIMMSIKGSNTDWNSEVDIIDALERLTDIRITITQNLNWDIKRQILSFLLTDFGYKISTIRLENILRQLDRAGVDWDRLPTIAEGLKNVADIHIDVNDWTPDQRKYRLIEILEKYQVDPKSVELQVILDGLNASKNIDWYSEYDIVNFLREIGVKLNIRSWNFTEYRQKLLEVFNKLLTMIPTDQIEIILRNLNEKNINWNLKLEIVRGIEEYSGNQISFGAIEDEELQEDIIKDLLYVTKLALSNYELKEIFNTLKTRNITISKIEEIFLKMKEDRKNLVAKNFSDYLQEN